MSNEPAGSPAIEAPLAPVPGAESNGRRPVPSYRKLIEFLANELPGEAREDLEAEVSVKAGAFAFGFEPSKIAADIYGYRTRGLRFENLENEIAEYLAEAQAAAARGDLAAADKAIRAAKRAKRGRG